MQPHVALLRGINVGGKNLIPMAELRVCFEELGFDSVSTYIQSGNVLFVAAGVDERVIETTLSKRFDYHGRVVVLDHRAYQAAEAGAPPDWGVADDEKHNALFTLAGTTPEKILDQLPEPSEFERITPAPGVIFWSAPKDRITKTMFVKQLAGHPAYQELTVRNHNTFFKLAARLAELAGH